MRIGLVVTTMILVGACTRPNGAYDLDGGGKDPTGTGDTAEPTDGSGPEPDTGGSSVGESADVTSVGSADGGSTTANETADCVEEMFQLTPIADTFVVSADGSMCGVVAAPCAEVNFGQTESARIEDFLGVSFRSYFLMSFDLSALPEPQTSYAATLKVTVDNGMPIVAEVFQVFPVSWDEGNDAGTRFAVEGEATWESSSHPEPWQLPDDAGTFEVALVLGDDVAFTEAEAGRIQTISFDIPDITVEEWFGGEDVIHLVVTVSESDGETLAYSRESANPPSLQLEGC